MPALIFGLLALVLALWALSVISKVDPKVAARVTKISQQTEVQVVDPIGQEPDFQGFHQIFDVLSAAEHCRNHGQSTQFRWNSEREVHAWQRMRRRQERR